MIVFFSQNISCFFRLIFFFEIFFFFDQMKIEFQHKQKAKSLEPQKLKYRCCLWKLVGCELRLLLSPCVHCFCSNMFKTIRMLSLSSNFCLVPYCRFLLRPKRIKSKLLMFEAILTFAHYLLFLFFFTPNRWLFRSYRAFGRLLCVYVCFFSRCPAYHQMQSVKIHNLWLCVLVCFFYSFGMNMVFLCMLLNAWFPISFTFHVEHFQCFFFWRSCANFIFLCFVLFTRCFVCLFLAWKISSFGFVCMWMWKKNYRAKEICCFCSFVCSFILCRFVKCVRTLLSFDVKISILEWYLNF